MTITLTDLYKRYTYQWIIKNANFQFQKNQIYGIAGANGSGKSTLIHIISGYLSPSKGKIVWENQGRQIDRHDQYKSVSICAPYIRMVEDFTISELLKLYTKTKPLIDLSTADFLKMAYIEQHSTKAIKYFSSGMKQRVQLLLAMATDCPVLLLDEPSSYLDQDAKAWFYQKLEAYAKDKLVIIASNDLDDLDQCGNVVTLDDIQLNRNSKSS